MQCEPRCNQYYADSESYMTDILLLTCCLPPCQSSIHQKMDQNAEPHMEGDVRKKAGGTETPKAKKGVINLASFGMQVAV